MPTTPSKMGQLARQKHAEVAWTAEDILEARPTWSVAKCNEWLIDNEDDIQMAMIEAGGSVISRLLLREDDE